MLLDPSDYGISDFLEILRRRRPDLLAAFGAGRSPITPPPEDTRSVSRMGLNLASAPDRFLEGTTILAAVYKDGVLIAGDRQATSPDLQVGERRIEKVYQVDEHSAIAIAGVAGPCIELAKLFRVQIEFYEKIEGSILSLEGKANYLSSLVKNNLGMALQGLYVIPIFAGYDLKRGQGRIFKYDITGGRYEETDYYAIGSGGKDARSTFKKRYQSNLSRDEILALAIEALWDAADEDLGTGGPDFIRDIFPTVKSVDREGISDVPESEVKELYSDLIERLSSA